MGALGVVYGGGQFLAHMYYRLLRCNSLDLGPLDNRGDVFSTRYIDGEYLAIDPDLDVNKSYAIHWEGSGELKASKIGAMISLKLIMETISSNRMWSKGTVYRFINWLKCVTDSKTW